MLVIIYLTRMIGVLVVIVGVLFIIVMKKSAGYPSLQIHKVDKEKKCKIR